MPYLNTISFPATDAAGETKLKKLIETIGEYLNAEIKVSPMVVLTATIDPDRPDVINVIGKIAAGLSKNGYKPAAPAKKEKAA